MGLLSQCTFHSCLLKQVGKLHFKVKFLSILSVAQSSAAREDSTSESPHLGSAEGKTPADGGEKYKELIKTWHLSL
jgi:hypothetical protein